MEPELIKVVEKTSMIDTNTIVIIIAFFSTQLAFFLYLAKKIDSLTKEVRLGFSELGIKVNTIEERQDNIKQQVIKIENQQQSVVDKLFDIVKPKSQLEFSR